ncbi:FmdE family protein [soil metagenome]
MSFPDFYQQAPTITVHDALAQLLGACSDGILTYHYLDAVRLTGHSCPTVAGAYLMTRRALELLYPGQTPERGAIHVQFSSAMDHGVTGVIASVVGLITGAAGQCGFKGIGRQFQRQNLMEFARDISGEACFTRTDNAASVTLAMQMGVVQPHPRTSLLLKKILTGLSSTDDNSEFTALWQERVKCILLAHADDPELIEVIATTSAN